MQLLYYYYNCYYIYSSVERPLSLSLQDDHSMRQLSASWSNHTYIHSAYKSSLPQLRQLTLILCSFQRLLDACPCFRGLTPLDCCSDLNHGLTINQSINRSIDRSIDRSINQSINQLINQSIN